MFFYQHVFSRITERPTDRINYLMLNGQFEFLGQQPLKSLRLLFFLIIYKIHE